MKSYITILAAVLFVSCFGLPSFADCPSADLTGDCFVDFEDFAVLAGQWLSSAEEPSGYLYWRENSAMLSKFNHPATVHDGWMVGGYYAEAAADNAGITMWNGNTYRFGASVDNDLGYGYEFLWSVKDVGLFTTTMNATSARNLLKSTDGIADFTVVATGLGAVNVQALNRCFVDCGRQTIEGVEKRLLFYFEYGATNASRVWYSATEADADAGGNGTWTDLFGATCPAINHFHGGIYVPNKGLYVFTGDNSPSSTAMSILFCSEADIGKSAANHGLITDAATWKTSDRWGLTAGTRAAWAANYHSAYVVGANDNKWRTVDLVTCDGKTGYWIPDSAPGEGGNSIYKIDFQDTTDSAGGTVTTLKSGGVPGYGWYGCGGKNGVAYISTLNYANVGAGGFSTGMQIGNDQYAHIYAIDTQTGEYADVKRIPRSDYIPSIGRYPKSGASFCFIKPLFEYGGEIWGETSFANGAREMTGVSYVQGMAYCGHVDRQQGTQTNIITNPDFTVGANGLTGWQVKVHQLTFQLGKSEIKVNDTVTGATSGATAVVSVVTLTSGSWAGGDGVGYLDLTSSSGDFDFAGNEILLVGATECATLKGGSHFRGYR